MVMIESAAPNPLDSIFQDFEKKSGWTLSPQAKTILKEGLEAVHVDMLGLGDFAVAVGPGPIVHRVIDALPSFCSTSPGRPTSATRSRRPSGRSAACSSSRT